MARASAKRAKRARSNARNAQRAVAQEAPAAAAPAAAPEPVRRPKPEPRKQEVERRGLLRRAKKPPKQKRPEDTMFFTRLRTHTKWVFVLLAVTFAIGFLAFGVGAGGTGVGDFIRELFGGSSGTVSLADLQKKVDENPADGDAVKQLATRLQSEQRYPELTSLLETYVKAKPNDAEALQMLASVYDARASRALEQANSLRTAATTGSFAATAFSFPGSNGFFGALGQSPVDDAHSAALQSEALKLGNQSDGFYTKELGLFERLTKLQPDNAALYAQVGALANQASQPEKAITAYEKYLELAPDGSLAQQVKDQLNQLKALESSGVLNG